MGDGLSLKKLFVYSSKKRKELIDALVSEKAEVESKSISAVIEQAILDGLLPANEDMRYYITECLYAKRKENAVSLTLDGVFAYNAAGINYKTKYDNLLPVVEFGCMELMYCDTVPTGEEKAYPHFLSQLKSVQAQLEYKAEEATDREEKAYLSTQAVYAKKLLEEATEEPEFVRFGNFFQLVVDNWTVLKTHQYTFQMLSDIAEMEQGWRDDAETKLRLLKILDDVSKGWK